MSLWVDRYRPKTLDKLDYHVQLSLQLKKLAKSGDVPHLLFYGPSGAGKKTRIMAFLRELYGPSTDKLKIEHKTLKPAPSKVVEVSTLASIYHIELNPSDVGIDDYHVVRLLLKEIASSSQLDMNHPFKIVVITEADKLTRKAQQALRRIMEKYVRNCRYVLVANSSSKILAPIRSRCLAVRVGAPTHEEIATVLESVGSKEHVKVAPELALKIAKESHRNLRRALLMLEACRAQTRSSSLEADTPIQLCDWEVYLHETAQKILQEQSPTRLLEVRGRLYELLTHCIPPDVILKHLSSELIKNLDGQLKVVVSRHAAEYEHRLQLGSKEIFHLEAFVAKFMSVYKRFILDIDFDF